MSCSIANIRRLSHAFATVLREHLDATARCIRTGVSSASSFGVLPSVASAMGLRLRCQASAARLSKISVQIGLVCGASIGDDYCYFDVSEGRLLLASGFLKVLKR